MLNAGEETRKNQVFNQMLEGMVKDKDINITERAAFRLAFMYICDSPDGASLLKDKCLEILNLAPDSFFAGYMTALCDEVEEKSLASPAPATP